MASGLTRRRYSRAYLRALGANLRTPVIWKFSWQVSIIYMQIVWVFLLARISSAKVEENYGLCFRIAELRIIFLRIIYDDLGTVNKYLIM